VEGRALPMVFSPSTSPDQRRGLPPSTCLRVPCYGFLLGLFERHFRRALKTPTAVVPPLKRIYGANGSLNFRCRRSMQNPSVRIGQCADLYGVFPAINVGLKHNIEKETLFFIKVPRFGGCF
jgi:hypothetical protein